MKTIRESIFKILRCKNNLYEDNSVETDIYYKPTNTHDYLPYVSAPPDHTKNNIPYNLAKRIIVFVSNLEKVINRLIKTFLKECKYLELCNK